MVRPHGASSVQLPRPAFEIVAEDRTARDVYREHRPRTNRRTDPPYCDEPPAEPDGRLTQIGGQIQGDLGIGGQRALIVGEVGPGAAVQRRLDDGLVCTADGSSPRGIQYPSQGSRFEVIAEEGRGAILQGQVIHDPAIVDHRAIRGQAEAEIDGRLAHIGGQGDIGLGVGWLSPGEK